MNASDVSKWKRCEYIAKLCGVKIILNGGFAMEKKNGETLGTVGTVNELYSFLCGYEHVPKWKKLCKPYKEPKC